MDSKIKSESVEWIPVQRSLSIDDGVEIAIGDEDGGDVVSTVSVFV